MKSPSVPRIDPSIAVSVAAVGLFVGVFGSSESFSRIVSALIEIAWRYLTQTRG
jgi:hypothetical protein